MSLGGFDAESKKRIAEAVRAVEEMDASADPAERSRQMTFNQPEFQHVQFIDLTPVAGYYKGKIETFNAVTGAITLAPADPYYVWLALGNAYSPSALNRTYQARRVGDLNGYPVFRVVAYVTNTQCIGGILVVTYG